MLRVYTSQSCGPCQIYKQNLTDLPVTIIDIDDENNLEMALNDGILMVPTSIMDDGTRWTGVKSRADVEAILFDKTS